MSTTRTSRTQTTRTRTTRTHDLDEADDDVDDEESEHATVASAATVETAKRLALEGLRKIVPVVDEADVEFVVLEEGSKGGLFGRGKVDAQVEARLRPGGAAPVVSDEGPPPGAEVLRAFVQGVVDRMGIEASVEAFDTPDAVHAEIKGDDLGILIGRHGTTIDALQYIAAIAVNGDRRHRRQVVVDAEGYRVRREVSLKALADRAAQKVARESSSVQLKPMTAVRAQGDPPPPQGPPARRDGLGGSGALPRRRHLAASAARLSAARARARASV